MNTTVSVPYDWLKQVPVSLLEKEEFPLLGGAPPFPWDQFTAVLAKVFQLENLKIRPGEMQTREKADLFKGLGSKPVPLHFDAAPLEGTLCWVIEESDLNKLMSLVLTKKVQAANFIDPDFKQGFFMFAALEIINIISKLDFEKSLTPHILSNTDLPDKASLCQDISISVDSLNVNGRLILSDELRRSWKEYFAKKNLTVEIPAHSAQKIQVVLHLEGGRTSLTLSEWENVQLGDFLVLDFCSIDPKEGKGRVMLTLEGKPLFRARVKEGNVKILESPLYHEVETTMSAAKEDNDEDLGESGEFHDEEFDEELEDEEYAEGVAAPPAPAPQAAAAAPKPAEAPAAATVAAAAPKVSPKDIPITVVVEVGRVQMSVQKLLELQPGNLLELNIHPENGVDLVVNGNAVGKGELLKIGDSLGVRILDKA